MITENFEEWEQQLRLFRNWQDPDGEYDFGAVAALFVACLENLQNNALESELEDLGRYLTGGQQRFLHNLVQHLQDHKGLE